MSSNGKHALITGGSRGIGRGIALKLAETGVNVAINYVQNKTAANDALAQVRERGAPVRAFTLESGAVPRRPRSLKGHRGIAEDLAVWCDNVDAWTGDQGFMNIVVGPTFRGEIP